MKKYWSRRLSAIEAYVPGEQVNGGDVIKLNTNENPYPPSEKALEALKAAADGALRLYPEPTSRKLRESIGALYGVSADKVFVGNGSDEVLAFSFMAFFGDEKPLLFGDITYSFYPVYADFFKVRYKKVPLKDDFTFPLVELCEASGGVIFPNPNAPTGIAMGIEDVEKIVSADMERVVIVDEAYVDFGGETAVGLVENYPNLLVIQTLSKSRSLAGLRVGFAIGDGGLIEALDCVKNCVNSYTVDGAAQAAACASIEDRDYFEQTRAQIISARTAAANRLAGMGFEVLDSRANFLFIRHSSKTGEELFHALRSRGILVRHFNMPRINNFLRVSIGTEKQMDLLCGALGEIISGHS